MYCIDPLNSYRLFKRIDRKEWRTWVHVLAHTFAVFRRMGVAVACVGVHDGVPWHGGDAYYCYSDVFVGSVDTSRSRKRHFECREGASECDRDFINANGALRRYVGLPRAWSTDLCNGKPTSIASYEDEEGGSFTILTEPKRRSIGCKEKERWLQATSTLFPQIRGICSASARVAHFEMDFLRNIIMASAMDVTCESRTRHRCIRRDVKSLTNAHSARNQGTPPQFRKTSAFPPR